MVTQGTYSIGPLSHHDVAIGPLSHHDVAIGPLSHHDVAIGPPSHHDVAIGPLSHQKKVPAQLCGGTCLIGHNWSLRKNVVSWLREVVGN